MNKKLTTSKQSTESVTAEELLRRATELAPRIKERAAEAEKLRQIPSESVQDLGAAGLLRVDTPVCYGGYEAATERSVAFDVTMELGRVCGSTAWCYGQWTVHTWMLAHWPRRAQDEYFAAGPDTLASSGLVPNLAHAESVAGGMKIWGRWQFSSGADASGWAFLGLPMPNGRLWALVPRSDYTIDDTWFVSGLRATGSKDLTIDEAFVPDYRLLDPDRAGAGNWTGWQLHKRDSYRLPSPLMTGWELVSPLVGIGQGAVDEFTARLRGTSGRGRTADSTSVQLRLAESSVEVDVARLLHLNDVREVVAKAGRGETFSELDRALNQRDKAFATRLCVRAVNRLFDASGGHALFESDPLQRYHRDVHAGSHQLRVQWDTFGEAYGRLALGLDAD